MSIKPLECYDRYVLTSTPESGQIVFKSTKGDKLIVPGMLYGMRPSHDGKKMRFILNDDIQRVFTLSGIDVHTLLQNSITADQAEEQGII